uniref:Uncharacterized protein n=1 Tax=Lotus japonicus TaxID=34305 RepID=I3S205_LOTJA|nr:unknown [Lotus japonicus]
MNRGAHKPVREGRFIGFENLLGHVWTGNHQTRQGAEEELHDGSIVR